MSDAYPVSELPRPARTKADKTSKKAAITVKAAQPSPAPRHYRALLLAFLAGALALAGAGAGLFHAEYATVLKSEPSRVPRTGAPRVPDAPLWLLPARSSLHVRRR